MFAVVQLQGRKASLPPGVYGHVIISAVLNILGFGLLTTFAQLHVMTARVVIVSYSMPVWASLMAWLLLGERPNTASVVGLLRCVSGLAGVVEPVAVTRDSVRQLLALGASLSRSAG